MVCLNIEKEEIHRLNSNVFPKEYEVIANHQKYLFSIHQALLLSASLSARFLNEESSITLNFENNKQISSRELGEAFSELYSLFFEKTEIELNSSNVQIFRLLASKIDNRFLQKQCGKVTRKKPCYFSLSFQHLITIDLSILQELSTFSLISPHMAFTVNPALFCCISDSFFALFSSGISFTSTQISVSKENTDCFLLLLSLLEGMDVIIDEDEVIQFKDLCEKLALTSFFIKIIRAFPPPQTIEDHINIIIFFSTSFYEEFVPTITFLSTHLSEISFDSLLRIPVSALQHILSSANISDDMLFDIVIKLISHDILNVLLLSIPKFENVKSSHVRSFFENFEFNQLFPDLFEALKPRMFFENADPLTQDQILQIIEKLNTLLKEDDHPFKKIMTLFERVEILGEYILFSLDDAIMFSHHQSLQIVEKLNVISDENCPPFEKLMKILTEYETLVDSNKPNQAKESKFLFHPPHTSLRSS